jgi:hypothetical protein
MLTDIYKIDHRSSGKKNHFVVSDSAIDDLNHPSYIGSKRSDEYSSLYSFDNIIKRFTDNLF